MNSFVSLCKNSYVRTECQKMLFDTAVADKKGFLHECDYHFALVQESFLSP